MFAFRRQPLKAVYLAYFLVTTLFIRLPLWTFMAFFPALRPRRSWPFRRALIFHALKAFVELFFEIGFPEYCATLWALRTLQLPYMGLQESPGFADVSIGQNPERIASSPDAGESGFTWVEPLANEQIVGELKELAVLNSVQALKTAGYWYPSPVNTGIVQTASPDEKVIMHLHSGGHVMGSAHPKGGPAGPFCNGLVQYSSYKVFSCGYRLSSSAPHPAANPFPAGVLDALAGYNYLVHTVGFQPQHVFICGDSAGGNLAIALVRYLTGNALSVLSLPVPRGVILVSPSVEWGLTHDGPNSSWRLNSGSDYSTPFFSGYTQKSLLGSLPVDMAYTSPWISPGSLKLRPSDIENLFQGFPATYLLAGEAEIARDSIRTIRDRLYRDIGKEQVTYNEMKDVTHDVVAMQWFEPERTNAIIGICRWVEQVSKV
ncbi:alpha/beta-hydrolase [Mycena crocata]|nr:alpha/beta-hydrolase [Mycena crocata]